ncbi:hypothetical protein AB0M43_08880 [Longispora sp. NPDC051575]|uniref:hypothetical protein n=1 Tax=Longispora sp. NPDC051575 TaxID=3154943 RepID=UPI003425551A
MTEAPAVRRVLHAGHGQLYLRDVNAYDTWMRTSAANDPDLHPDHHVDLPAGRYRVRITYLPSDPPDAEPGDYFTYRIDIWPTSTTAATTVIRQGPDPW